MKISIVSILLVLSSLFIFNQCTQPPDYPTIPEIEYISLFPTTIRQGSLGAPPDTLQILFSFTDGEGDFGFPSSAIDSFDIFFTDSRLGITTERKFPVIPEQGAGNGISGEVTLKIPNSGGEICCTPAFAGGQACVNMTDIKPIDTVSFTLQIRDRAGNFSNKIQTEQLIILCQ